jgi:beta-galactosidase
MNSAQFVKLFPLGSHLCREPMPPLAELKRDMENLKRHGFNLIKLQEHWAVDEPVEGEYDFSRYEELIAHAADLDLGVYLGLTCEQAPAWLWRKHPNCRMVGRNGLPIAYEAQTTLPSDGKPGPCYDHPGAREDQLRFIRELVRTLGRYENLVVWNTWQEIGYWAEALVEQPVCYCPHTLTAFREWLRQEHGSLESLNGGWNTRYGAWEDAAPDRNLHPPPSAVNIAWGYFMANVQIASVLRDRAEAIRAADPLGRPVFAHVGAPSIGAGQDWTYARCQDFLGSSCYPAWAPFQAWDARPAAGDEAAYRHAALLAEMAEVALRFDYLRSCQPAGAPVWAAEFQGGPVSTGLHKGRVPSGEDLRRWMLTAVGSGTSAICFWVTRAEIMADETNGFGLLDSEGDSTPRFAEAARVGRALNAHPDLFGSPAWPGAEVAVVVDEWNYQTAQLVGDAGAHVAYSVRGWHRLLWEAGVAVDFLEVSHLDEARLGQYRALIWPFPLSVSEETVHKLGAYVTAGGNLVAEACPGRLSLQGFATRGELSPGARELFGVRQADLCMVREPEGPARWMPAERTWGEFAPATDLTGVGALSGQQVRANLYLETFACAGAEPCLLAGEAVAGAVHQVRAGRTWLVGTLLGHNGTAYREEPTGEFVRALLGACGVAAPAGPLLLRRRVTPEGEAWLFTNAHAEAVSAQVDVTGWAEVTELGGESLARTGDVVTVTVAPCDVKVLVLRRRV